MTTTENAVTRGHDLEAVLDAAVDAAEPLARLRPTERANLLREVANALDGATEELVALAQDETKLPEARLRGELVRTTFQLRLFGEVLEEGAYLDATLDSADENWPTGARPDMRKMLLPLGPVLVFAASNFPFAFSVAGGDTASAWAAGCPVVVKTHPGHPRLSRRTGEIISATLRSVQAPDGVFALIEGQEAGRTATCDPRVRAGAFTGSTQGGRALFDLAASRPEPIPFYAEMGSVNPTFVTRGAAAERGSEIADGYLNSFTLGAGQFCTKPGLLFVPAESADEVESALVSGLAQRPAAPMLNAAIEDGYWDTLNSISEHSAVRVAVRGERTENGPTPTLLRTTARDVLEQQEALTAECFGPTSIVVEYGGDDEMLEAARMFRGELTATVHGRAEEANATLLCAELQQRAGRVVWNGWPTGVSVSHAMQHGGPYPATTAPTHTSVGTAAIERFLRPVCFQNMPGELLPEALRDGNPLDIPRRVDGRIERGSQPS
ncbi:aldehyde dehydrogenase (NADP(+)) [Parasphingorhabdus pacifica]